MYLVFTLTAQQPNIPQGLPKTTDICYSLLLWAKHHFYALPVHPFGFEAAPKCNWGQGKWQIVKYFCLRIPLFLLLFLSFAPNIPQFSHFHPVLGARDIRIFPLNAEIKGSFPAHSPCGPTWISKSSVCTQTVNQTQKTFITLTGEITDCKTISCVYALQCVDSQRVYVP